MPTLILENVPPDLYEQLQQRAEANNQSIAMEAVHLLRKLLPDEPFLSEEISAPCTLPLPGEGIPVKVREGGKLLPEPFSWPDDSSTAPP